MPSPYNSNDEHMVGLISKRLSRTTAMDADWDRTIIHTHRW